ncbi:hypothetical protein QJS10_CPB18g00165 [Acorus calamus]|uniref:Glucose-6-phosphate 1-epimerase n=1 Tax=Acorus calamus TaxID=4465 RepID=A0AAV9CN39_ACOCL|nr:hypothetical protein QJS10_CPB18g00165 [Acorus calamus]
MSGEKIPVQLCKGVNGLDKVVLREPKGFSAEFFYISAWEDEVYLYGGQVTSWKNNFGEEMLFVSNKAIFKPPKAVHGGISICFPRFGSHGSLERQGFVRNRFWSIDTDPPSPIRKSSSSKAYVDLIFKPSVEDAKVWPHSEIRIEGLETRNYLDNLQNKELFTEQQNAITFESEIDKIYLSTPNKIAVIDHKRRRTFVIKKDGLPDAVVWNPWDKKAKAMVDFGNDEYQRMLCVDAANEVAPIKLKPGEEWRGKMELSVVHSSYNSGQLLPQKVSTGR